MGIWKPNRTKKTHFKVLPNGRIWIALSSKGTSSHYVIMRRYYMHGKYNRFHRNIKDLDMEDEDLSPEDLIILGDCLS